jgi:Na+-transporting methylmalonyl-CoA/oxaloacetate decarboxylase gamma subunit
MNNAIQQGLLITVIGMGLVFAVIIFLWWMMNALVRATTKDEDQEDSLEEQVGPGSVPMQATVGLETQRRVAAVAVAVALAIKAAKAGHLARMAQGEVRGMSPWQSVHRANQLEPHKKRG